MDINFNTSDLKTISENLKKHQFRAKIEKDLNYFIERYQQFVTDVENGYPLEIYSYTNDLSMISILDRLGDKLSDDGQEKLGSILEPFHSRFKRATTFINRPLLGDYPKNNWWYYRIPRVLEGKLKEDLISEGGGFK